LKNIGSDSYYAIMLSRQFIRPGSIALRAASRRLYSDNGAGSVAQSKGFQKKERAHEDQYARQREQEELKKLRDELRKVKKEVTDLKGQVKENDKK